MVTAVSFSPSPRPTKAVLGSGKPGPSDEMEPRGHMSVEIIWFNLLINRWGRLHPRACRAMVRKDLDPGLRIPSQGFLSYTCWLIRCWMSYLLQTSMLLETWLLPRFSRKVPSLPGNLPGHLSLVTYWCMNPQMAQSRYLEVYKQASTANWNLSVILKVGKNYLGVFLYPSATEKLEKKLIGTGCHAFWIICSSISHFHQTPVLVAGQGQEPLLIRLENSLGAGFLVC